MLLKTNKKNCIAIAFMLSIASFSLYGQIAGGEDRLAKDIEPKQMLQVYVDGGFAVTGADLAKRFGYFSSLGIGLGYKTYRNITAGLTINTLFAPKVIDNTMLNSMRGSSGELLDANGNYAVINTLMRGTMLVGQAGKIFAMGSNKNSGLWLQGGFVYLSTHIKFQYPSKTLPQLDDNMYKGYDRLTGGLGLIASIGYHHITANNTLSYYIKTNFINARTQSLRTFQYDQIVADQSIKRDLIMSINAGIILPIRAKTLGKESFYK